MQASQEARFLVRRHASVGLLPSTEQGRCRVAVSSQIWKAGQDDSRANIVSLGHAACHFCYLHGFMLSVIYSAEQLEVQLYAVCLSPTQITEQCMQQMCYTFCWGACFLAASSSSADCTMQGHEEKDQWNGTRLLERMGRCEGRVYRQGVCGHTAGGYWPAISGCCCSRCLWCSGICGLTNGCTTCLSACNVVSVYSQGCTCQNSTAECG